MKLTESYQQKLFPYAYNILGSVDDAMDAVQDVVTRYVAGSKQEIENEMGYLIKGVINQSINLKKRNQKIMADKLWLPEPVSTDHADANIHREEIISYSVLVVLEKLNPKERAVFILREAFDYSHEDIANALSFSVENSRKLLSRAKKALEKTDTDLQPSSIPHPSLLQKYMGLIKDGNVVELEKILSADMMVKTDGGTVSIVSGYMAGVQESIHLMLHVYNAYQKDFEIVESVVNHQPALLFYDNKQLVNCQVFEFEKDGAKIKAIYSVVDPAKLK